MKRSRRLDKQFKSPVVRKGNGAGVVGKRNLPDIFSSRTKLGKSFNKFGLDLNVLELDALKTFGKTDPEIRDLLEEVAETLPQELSSRKEEERRLQICERACKNHPPQLLEKLIRKWKEAVVDIVHDMKQHVKLAESSFCARDGNPAENWSLEALFRSLGFNVERYFTYDPETDSIST